MNQWKVHYHVHKWSQLDFFPGQLKPVHEHTNYPISLQLILILRSHLCLGLQVGFSIRFVHSSNHPHPHYMPTTHPLYHLFFTIICGEDVKLLNSSLWNFLHFPVPSTVLILNICLSTLFSNPPYMCYSLKTWLQNCIK